MQARLPRIDLQAMAPQMIRMVGRGKFKCGETKNGWTSITFSFLHRTADLAAAKKWTRRTVTTLATCLDSQDAELNEIKVSQLGWSKPEEPVKHQFEIELRFTTWQPPHQATYLSFDIQNGFPELRDNEPWISEQQGKFCSITFRCQGKFVDQIAADRWGRVIGRAIHDRFAHDGLTGEFGVTVSGPDQPLRSKAREI